MALTLGAGAATVTVVQPPMDDLAVPAMDWSDGTELDGHVFYTTDTVQETGELVHDTLVFKDGTFQSDICQEYCDFGWSEYRTHVDGDVTHFTTRTACPEAPHTVVWYGTVTGDQVTFLGTWTTRRWYWSRQLNVTGIGDTTPLAAHSKAG